MTVSGFTITNISRQFGNSQDRGTQSRRSVGRSEGRREVLFFVAKLMPKSNDLKLEGCAPTEAVAER